MRDFKKIKTMKDFELLDSPISIGPEKIPDPTNIPEGSQMVLRMLVRPKYGDFLIPEQLQWLEPVIRKASELDKGMTGIEQSWCYVTIRHGFANTKTDDEFHFDGASFRTSLIPERNYVWVSNSGFEYKTGRIQWPSDFDPNKHNLFSFAEKALSGTPSSFACSKMWHLLTPFCLHRRDPESQGKWRTFIRIAFTDIEGRDINNTHNPKLPTPFYGRDPVRDFRDKLVDYT